MNKRFMAALLALCLMLIGLPSSAEVERFTSMEELKDYLFYDCANMLADEIEFGYMQSLDHEFSEDFPWDMLYNMGIRKKYVSIDRQHCRLTIADIEYYPGFKAARAWAMGKTDMLSEEERAILSRAEVMVEDARRYAQSPYQVLVNLHDALVQQVVFTAVEEDFVIQDTAVGALLYGQAECDGYADAFYLLCTLSGFPVQMISGESGNEDGSEMDGHMWNLVWLEDGWYHMDVSWDDLDWTDDAAMTSYRYFMMGSSLMTTHRWPEEQLAEPSAPHTNWNHCYYTADGTGITYGAYYHALQDAANYAVYMHRNFDQRMIHMMVDGNYEGQFDRINQALTDSGLKGSWWTWAVKRNDYSFISIYIEE